MHAWSPRIKDLGNSLTGKGVTPVRIPDASFSMLEMFILTNIVRPPKEHIVNNPEVGYNSIFITFFVSSYDAIEGVICLTFEMLYLGLFYFF